MIRTICLTLLLVVASEFNLVAASLLQTQSDATLSNKDVVELVKIGLSPEVIVAKIKNSVCKFDTSTTALQELKAAHVPDAVILAMVQAPAGVQNSSLAASTSEPVEKPGVKNLYEVRRIYLDEMGKSDDAERFRLLLSEKLSEKGFTIVENPDDADGILKGVLSTQLSEGTTRARVSVFLKSASGQQLWSEDYGVRMVFGLPSRRRDSIKLRAEDVANGLHGAWKKSAKAAGLKNDK